MKICVFTICKNEAAFMPFFLRHYSSFADKIIVWDESSDDGTRDMIKACPKAELRNWMARGIDDYAFKHFAEDAYKEARGKFDWCIWCDVDELMWAPDIRSLLATVTADMVPSRGYNMVGDGLPKDDGRQIWEINPMGVEASVYSKKQVFRPECDIIWATGRHHIHELESNCRLSAQPIRLLHYRFLGSDYTRARNARNYTGNVDKGHAWTCAPDWHGAHSPDYAEEIKQHAFNVLTTPMYMELQHRYDDIALGDLMDCNRHFMFGSVELTSTLPGHFRYIEIGLAHASTMAGIIRTIQRNKIDPWFAIGVDKMEGGWRYDVGAIERNLAEWNPDFSGQPSSIPNRPQIFSNGSEAFLRQYSPGPNFNFALIDACHSTACCTRDFILLEPLMKTGGIIAFHDADEKQQGDEFDIQPHCGLGIGVRKALHCMDLLNGKRPGWSLLADTVPTEQLGGRGAVFIQKT